MKKTISLTVELECTEEQDPGIMAQEMCDALESFAFEVEGASVTSAKWTYDE